MLVHIGVLVIYWFKRFRFKTILSISKYILEQNILLQNSTRNPQYCTIIQFPGNIEYTIEVHLQSFLMLHLLHFNPLMHGGGGRYQFRSQGKIQNSKITPYCTIIRENFDDREGATSVQY